MSARFLMVVPGLDLTCSLLIISQGVSQSQHLLIPTDRNGNGEDPEDSPWEEHQDAEATPDVTLSEIRELLQSLPRNLHRDKKSKAGSSLLNPAASNALETLEEEDEAEDNADEGLQIAWQYRKDVQQKRLGRVDSTSKNASDSDVFCHSYDLQGRLDEQMNVEEAATVVPIHCCDRSDSCNNRTCAMLYYRRLLAQVTETLSGNPRTVVRLLLYHPRLAVMSVALPLLLTHIRTHQLPVVILVSVQPWASCGTPSTIRLLKRACDVVLETEGFASRQEYPPPAEFRSLHGLLKIRKMSTVTAATAHGGGHFADLTVTKRPAANLYGLKRDRRKLHIQLLHIPPEDYAEGGGSVGGGVRSGAGRPAKKESSSGGCGTGGGASPLDF
jgi:hypothetical protein